MKRGLRAVLLEVPSSFCIMAMLSIAQIIYAVIGFNWDGFITGKENGRPPFYIQINDGPGANAQLSRCGIDTHQIAYTIIRHHHEPIRH